MPRGTAGGKDGYGDKAKYRGKLCGRCGRSARKNRCVVCGTNFGKKKALLCRMHGKMEENNCVLCHQDTGTFDEAPAKVCDRCSFGSAKGQCCWMNGMNENVLN